VCGEVRMAPICGHIMKSNLDGGSRAVNFYVVPGRPYIRGGRGAVSFCWFTELHADVNVNFAKAFG
jgi:hypothetical protein